MIVNIRGTNGAGKTTVVKRVVERFTNSHPHFVEGRKQPYYTIHSGGAPCALWVPGHYAESVDCGGCDTLKTVDDVYDQVRRGADQGYNVLYEGIMLMDESRRAIELSKHHSLVVIYLTTPLEDCIARVENRREGKNQAPYKLFKTIRREKTLQAKLRDLRAAGVPVFELDGDAAAQKTLELVGVVV